MKQMKDRHLYVAEDTQLLKDLHAAVAKGLQTDDAWLGKRLLVKFLVYALLVMLCYGLMLLADTPIVLMASYVSYGFFALLLAFNFAHDLSHNTVFERKWLNQFLFACHYTMLGAHAEAWRHRHVHSHHYAPNVAGYDSDLNITQLIRVVPGSAHFAWHRFQHWYAPLAYTTYSLFWIGIKDFVLLFDRGPDGPPKTAAYYGSFVVQKVFYLSYILLLPMQVSPLAWGWVLAGFVAMHLVQSLFLLFTFFMTHHVEGTAYPKVNSEGIIGASWLMNQVKSSNDMHPFSETANFIFGGFNNHIAHHLFPHIHHLYYPALNRIIYPILVGRGIVPNKTSYWGGVLSHWRLLRRLGRGGD